MTDGRRRRWVAHDVHFLDEPLGAAMFDRFGAAGVSLWFGFISACKRYHIEGSCSWASDAEALGLFGLPGMTLVDNDGEPFGLSDWLGLLSDHKVIRRTVRGRRVKVVCTQWGRWQQVRNRSNSRLDEVPDRSNSRLDEVPDRSPTEDDHEPDTSDGGQHNRRSDGENAAGKPPNNVVGIAPDLDLDLDLDLDRDQTLAPDKPARKPRPPDHIFDALVSACGLSAGELTKSARGRLNKAAKELRDVGASPEGIAARARVHRQRWPDAELTPTSLAANYAQLGASRNGSRSPPPADACQQCAQALASHDDDLHRILVRHS